MLRPRDDYHSGDTPSTLPTYPQRGPLPCPRHPHRQPQQDAMTMESRRTRAGGPCEADQENQIPKGERRLASQPQRSE
jgi:hypothetical protein